MVECLDPGLDKVREGGLQDGVELGFDGATYVEQHRVEVCLER